MDKNCERPRAPNKKGVPTVELTLRTSVITHGSKGELGLRGTFFIWCTRALDHGIFKIFFVFDSNTKLCDLPVRGIIY